MNRYLRVSIAALVCTLTFAGSLLAQAQPAPQTPASTIKLQVVLSRYEGDKKVSSFPYTLSLFPGEPGNVRTGTEIAVPTTGSPGAYTMQQVGTQIDATAAPTPDGKYKLTLTVTDRSIVTGAPATQGGVGNIPSFRSNTTASKAVLSAGETIQFTSSSDKPANEIFKIDVTLTVGNK